MRKRYLGLCKKILAREELSTDELVSVGVLKKAGYVNSTKSGYPQATERLAKFVLIN